MLCFDTNLLGDYLDGLAPARNFLEPYEHEAWAIPSLALFEAYMGAVYGRPRGSIEDVHRATREFEILPVTDDVARAAALLQRELKADGIELGAIDVLLVAAAETAGAKFATNDGTIRSQPVKERVAVVDYER